MTLLSQSYRVIRRLTPSIAFTTLFVLAVCAGVAGAQNAAHAVTSVTPDATRGQLTHRLDSLLRIDSTTGKVNDRRARSQEIAALRERLKEGDFQTGDRFIIDYGNPAQRPDTVLVRDSANVTLFNWPSHTLRGVLRSELQGSMEKYVATYVREPRIRVYTLTRLTFTGGVGRPGTHTVDPSRSLSDAILDAGGISQLGKSDKVTVYRGNKRLMNAKQVASAIRDGTTVEDLGLQPGDEVRVPEQKLNTQSTRATVQNWLFGISIVTAILAFIRASYVP